MSEHVFRAASARYARALFETAQEQGALDQVATDMEALAQVTAHPEVSNWLADPRVDAAGKQELIERELGSRVSPLTGSLLKVIGRRQRHEVLPGVPVAFRSRLDDHNARLRGLVESARPLSDDQRQGLERAMSATTGRTVELEQRVDESLLGGLRVTLGSTRFDGSVRGRLDRMRRRIEVADLGPPPAATASQAD